MKIFKRLLGILSISVLLSNMCSAQNYSNELGNVDIAGVHLGMSPTKTIDALKLFDEDFVIDKRFVGSKEFHYAQIGTDRIDKKITGKEVLSGIVATKDNDDFHDAIAIYLSPSDEQNKDLEKVTAVIRWKTYFNNKPRIDTLEKAIEEKIGKEPSVKRKSKNIWIFSPRGKIETPTNAKNYNYSFAKYSSFTRPSKEKKSHSRLLMEAYDSGNRRGLGRRTTGIHELMPRSIREDNPANLQLIMSSDRNNKLIASGFTMLLIDPKELTLTYFNFKELMEKRIKEYEIEQAKQNTSTEKF